VRPPSTRNAGEDSSKASGSTTPLCTARSATTPPIECPKSDQRQLWVGRTHAGHDVAQVGDELLEAVDLGARPLGAAVAALVVAVHREALRRQACRQLVVAADVLAQPVDEHQAARASPLPSGNHARVGSASRRGWSPRPRARPP
jgi:hypothetical protein